MDSFATNLSTVYIWIDPIEFIDAINNGSQTTEQSLIQSKFIDQVTPTCTVDDEGANTESQRNRRNDLEIHKRTDNDLDVEVFLQHFLQRAVFVLMRLGDEVEVSDIRLVGRRRQSIAQQWSDPAVNPVRRSNTIQREPHLWSHQIQQIVQHPRRLTIHRVSAKNPVSASSKGGT